MSNGNKTKSSTQPIVRMTNLRKTPGPVAADLCFYHWAPQARRQSILRYGLRPGMKSLQGDWRPPHICFSDEPRLAWILSGFMHSEEIKDWDLWMVFSHDAEEWEAIVDTFRDSKRTYVKEYRVYHRIFKRHVHYIGSRSSDLT